MKFPDGVSELLRLFGKAIKLEIGTVAGKVNLIGMVLWTLLVLAASAQGLVNSIIEAIRPEAETDSTKFRPDRLCGRPGLLSCDGSYPMTTFGGGTTEAMSEPGRSEPLAVIST